MYLKIIEEYYFNIKENGEVVEIDVVKILYIKFFDFMYVDDWKEILELLFRLVIL